jgi:hypothetical protein
VRIIRLAAVAATVSSMALIGAASASADNATCNAGGMIKLSPGLSTTPEVQNVTIKGTLAGCTSSESRLSMGKFKADFQTAEPISCETLASAGAAGEGTVVLKWKPKQKLGNSTGTFSVPITEAPNALISGMIDPGVRFAEQAIGGSITETFGGGHHCGERKNGKNVTKGTFVGSLSVS